MEHNYKNLIFFLSQCVVSQGNSLSQKIVETSSMPKPGKDYDNFLINYNICGYPL